MRLSRQFQICVFYLFIFFFFMKRFRAYKSTHKQTLTNKTKKAYKKQQRQRFLVHIKTPERVVGFGAFCTREIFS